jgi:hypothetical protein
MRPFNTFEEDPVRLPGLMGPGDKVFKGGRTTGTTNGHMKSFVVLTWQDGTTAKELCVLGEGSAFATQGDNGCLSRSGTRK